MEAVVLTAHGDVDKLEVKDRPEPSAGPDEIKVRMAGASINPVDWKLRSGALQAAMPLMQPAILGRRGAHTGRWDPDCGSLAYRQTVG
jgi:NADPH:quinone reductase-like Zn-dependent oxidoreductase